MKPKLPFEDEVPEDSPLRDYDFLYVERVPDKLWWKHPSFHMELNLPFPFIWFGYWLISWKWDDYQLPLWKRRVEEWLGISFMPD